VPGSGALPNWNTILTPKPKIPGGRGRNIPSFGPGKTPPPPTPLPSPSEGR